MGRAFDRALVVLVGACLLVPLVVAPAFSYPFTAPKVLLFRSLVELMVVVWLLRWALTTTRSGIGRPSPVMIVGGLYVLSWLLSTVAGVDSARSMWDAGGRMLGVYTVLHYAAFCFVVSRCVTTWIGWQRLLAVAIGGGVIVMALGSVQRWIDPEFLWNRDTTRAASTLGRAGALGAYGIALIFWSLLLFVRSRVTAYRWLGAMGIVAGGAGVVGSETRGAVLGLAAGVLVLLVGVVLTLPRERRCVRRLALAALVAAAAAGPAIYVLRGWEGMEAVPGLRRFRNVSLAEGTLRTRVLMWGVAIDAARDRPLLGWGPNNFYYAHDAHYDPESLAHGWNETWLDDAHNIVLNALVERGIPGAATTLLLFAAPIGLLWRRQRRGDVGAAAASIMTALLVAHLVQNLFLFDDPSSLLLLVLALAFVDVLTRPPSPVMVEPTLGIAADRGRLVPAMALAMAIPVAVAVGGLLWSTNVCVARANVAGLQALRSVDVDDDRRALELLARAEAFRSPQAPAIRMRFAQRVLRRLNALAEARQPVLARGGRPDDDLARRSAAVLELSEAAFVALACNRRRHPRDGRVVLGEAKLLIQVETTFTLRELDGRPDHSVDIVPALARLHDESSRQEAAFLLSALTLMGDRSFRGRTERLAMLVRHRRVVEAKMLEYALEPEIERRGAEAKTLLREAIEDSPAIAEGWWRLALVHSSLGDNEQARRTLEEAETHGVVFEGMGGRVAAALGD